MSSGYPPFGGLPVQRCLRCGSPLPANVVTCMNCGTYNPVAQPSAYADQGQVQSGSMQPQASMNGRHFSGAQFGQPFISPNNFYPMQGQDKHANFNGYYVAPQQNANYYYPSKTYQGYGQPSPQKKRGSGVGFIVGIGLLVLFFVGGGFSGYFFFFNSV